MPATSLTISVLTSFSFDPSVLPPSTARTRGHSLKAFEMLRCSTNCIDLALYFSNVIGFSQKGRFLRVPLARPMADWRQTT